MFPHRYPAAKATKLRARQHPWARVARRFSRAASQRLSEDPPDEPPSERVWDVLRTTEEVVAELKRGNEADADTRRWVAACEQASASCAQDALRCAARFTTLRSARNLLEHLAGLSADERRTGALALASAARDARPKCWAGPAAARDASRRDDAESAARTWAAHLSEETPVNHKAREETRRARAEGWRVEGSEYLGRTVRRSVLDASGKPISHSEGCVRGWLDASRSDYNDAEGKPAALWHVYFSSGELEGDEEDLELYLLRRPVAFLRSYAIDATRLHLLMKWVVSFSISRPFLTEMLRAGPNYSNPWCPSQTTRTTRRP